MILNQAQAQAVYDAMCALNNVGSTYLRVNFPCKAAQRISFAATNDGISIKLTAHQGNPAEQIEEGEGYTDQGAFVTAYRL